MTWRTDKNGNLDICRVEFTAVNPAAKAIAERIKLETNALMGVLLSEHKTAKHPEVQRLLVASLTAYEEACMWAVKALTSELWSTGRSIGAEPFEFDKKKDELSAER